jgi:rsbT antagonist protein RsbS
MVANRIPILRVADKLLISIQVELTDQTIALLQSDVLGALEKRPARGVLIDISALEIVDSYMGRMLVDTAKQVSIMGARAVVTGIQPPVAVALIEMGISLEEVETSLDVDSGIQLLDDLLHDPGNSANDARDEMPE